MQDTYLDKFKKTNLKNIPIESETNQSWNNDDLFENEDLFDNDQVYLYYLKKWASQNTDLEFSFIVPKGIPKKKYRPFTKINK